MTRSRILLGLLVVLLSSAVRAQYEDDYDTETEDPNYYDDGYDDQNGYDDYDTTEPTDPDYNTDYGSGGDGDIETNTNGTMNCSVCFVPRPQVCTWNSLGGLRYPSFIRHFQPTMKIITFGSWGSLTNNNRFTSGWGSGGSRWGGGRRRGSYWGGGGGWSGNYGSGGSGWNSNRWISANSCLWTGGSCGGNGVVQVSMNPGCNGGGLCSGGCGNSCSGGSSNLWGGGNGWFGRFSSSQKMTSGRNNNSWNSNWSSGSGRYQSGGGGRFGGGFGGIFDRLQSKWGGGKRNQGNSMNNNWNRWGQMQSGRNKNGMNNIFSSWFGK